MSNKMFEPVIKWSGSKRSQAFEILGQRRYWSDLQIQDTGLMPQALCRHT